MRFLIGVKLSVLTVGVLQEGGFVCGLVLGLV